MADGVARVNFDLVRGGDITSPGVVWLVGWPGFLLNKFSLLLTCDDFLDTREQFYSF